MRPLLWFLLLLLVIVSWVLAMIRGNLPLAGHQGVKAEDFDRLMPVLMAQAEALYAEWPIAA